MFNTACMLLVPLLYSLQLGTGSFPKPLTQQEEQHYLALSAKGDLEARNILIERNLRLVAHIMKKYYAQADDQEDLISIGTIGLIKGISSYDPQKGVRLATYAARCVENEILMYFRSQNMSYKTQISFDKNIPCIQISVCRQGNIVLFFCFGKRMRETSG